MTPSSRGSLSQPTIQHPYVRSACLLSITSQLRSGACCHVHAGTQCAQWSRGNFLLGPCARMPLACWASWPLIPAEKAGPAADDRKPAPSAAKQRAAAPARTACEADRKWVVEHHLDNHDIVLGDTNPRQTVYIFGCRNCTVQARPAAWGVALGPPKGAWRHQRNDLMRNVPCLIRPLHLMLRV